MGYAKPSKSLKQWVVSKYKSVVEVSPASQPMKMLHEDKPCV